MNVNSIIVEQLEWNGLLKSVTMNRKNKFGELWISFPDEYLEERNSPFHFLDKKYKKHFESKQEKGRITKLSEKRFSKKGNDFYFNTLWNGIRTERFELTFYSIYLPEFAVPTEIKITDSNPPHNEFKKTVYKDLEKNRFVIYLECRSKVGIFNFTLNSKFHEDVEMFKSFEYNDNKTVDFYHTHKYEDFLPEITKQKVVTILNQTIMNGDTYNVNQAGAVGPNSSSNNNTFNQQINNIPESIDYGKLSQELSLLKKSMIENATEAEHFNAIAEITNAEKATEEKDANKVASNLKKAGNWALDVGTKIGVSLVTEFIKLQMKE